MSGRRMPSAKDQQRRAHNWNLHYPVGTAVTVTLDDGTKKPTVTVCEAWVLGGHTAVILLDGITGAYNLERVEAARG